MKMTYQYTSKYIWIPLEGDVEILKTTKKSISIKCDDISLRLKRSEIVDGAKITRSGYHEGSDYYIVITVEEAEDQ